MTGYGEDEKAYSFMDFKHLMSSTGVVRVLHLSAHASMNQQKSKKEKDSWSHQSFHQPLLEEKKNERPIMEEY
jgi:hypothetical protein